ncbi:penicillin-binding protein [Corynebacterium phocae]|uniref:Penicillin-binding protein n=1 Tax=Corynebacterium phocae TaxID=161895 RepID=A0A1L7D0D5_9CORY|nr:penicillin-binding protein 2 [Corynebacterium phocae]APT91605.1 penicillin-binding protein [Corynebacterium phocae]KAA8720674.1 penicillin-binding protein 2 [Corynebacterium phocae]
MNRSIRIMALFSLLLVAILLVNLTVIQAFSTDKYAENPLNRRGYYELRTIARGQIYADNTVLAQSTADSEGVYTRTYPETSPAYSPITGYLSQIYGAANLEASYNAVLNGTDPSLFTNNWMDTITGKQHAGANVEVSIDPALQQLAYTQLNSQGYEGAAVAIQPSTGKILAMASSPSYAAADIANPETAEQTWAQLQEQPGNPFVNHATADTLPPGSIFKIVTTAAGLSNGFNPESPLTGQPSIFLPGTETELTNYDSQICGGAATVTLTTAFALSCNTAFVQMSEAIGAEELRKYADGFGIGQQYDLGVPSASGSLGELPDAAQTAQSAIGQRDVTMSALQAAIMAGTVANKGVRMQPYLVERITDAKMKEISTTKPRVAAQAVEEPVANTLRDLMFASERNTFGYDGNGFASKTGTAEHGEGLPPHVWYVAFDPERDIAVAVVVKDGGNLGTGATGGQVSSPIGRALLYAYNGGDNK